MVVTRSVLRSTPAALPITGFARIVKVVAYRVVWMLSSINAKGIMIMSVGRG